MPKTKESKSDATSDQRKEHFGGMLTVRLAQATVTGAISQTELLEEVTSILTVSPSSKAAQIFNKLLIFDRFVCPVVGSDGSLFENWVRVDPNDSVFSRYISDDVYLFKDLRNTEAIDYPHDFYQVQSVIIDISKYDKKTIQESVEPGAYKLISEGNEYTLEDGRRKITGQEAKCTIAEYLFERIRIPYDDPNF